MADDFRGSDSVRESIGASGGSPINAADLFEEQAGVKNIPKQATQQLGRSENQGQSMPKEAPLSQSENAQGQATRNEDPSRPTRAEGNVTRNEAPVPPNAEGHGTRIGTRNEAPVPPTAEGHGTRVGVPSPNAEGEITRTVPPNAEGQITRNDQPWQTRVGLARDGDRTRPVSPIDLSPSPYGSGIPWQAGGPGPERDIMKGPKFRPDASDSVPANRPGSTPPRPIPFSPIDLDPRPRPRPGTPEWDNRPIPEVNRPNWSNWGR